GPAVIPPRAPGSAWVRSSLVPSAAAGQQHLAEAEQRARVALAGGGRLDPQDEPGLLVGQPLETAQRNDLAVFLGQPGDGLAQLLGRLLLAGLLAGRWLAAAHLVCQLDRPIGAGCLVLDAAAGGLDVLAADPEEVFVGGPLEPDVKGHRPALEVIVDP